MYVYTPCTWVGIWIEANVVRASTEEALTLRNLYTTYFQEIAVENTTPFTKHWIHTPTHSYSCNNIGMAD